MPEKDHTKGAAQRPQSESSSPMDRFRRLARRLVAVSTEELREASAEERVRSPAKERRLNRPPK